MHRLAHRLAPCPRLPRSYVEPAAEEGDDSPAWGGAAASGSPSALSPTPGEAVGAAPVADAGLRGTICEIVSASRFYIHSAADAPKMEAISATLAGMLAEFGSQVREMREVFVFRVGWLSPVPQRDVLTMLH
jgi:hypothetical protein